MKIQTRYNRSNNVIKHSTKNEIEIIRLQVHAWTAVNVQAHGTAFWKSLHRPYTKRVWCGAQARKQLDLSCLSDSECQHARYLHLSKLHWKTIMSFSQLQPCILPKSLIFTAKLSFKHRSNKTFRVYTSYQIYYFCRFSL